MAHLYEGPERAPEQLVRVHTGEGFWGDKELFLAEVNGFRLWDPDTRSGRVFKTFVVKNDVRVLPGQIDLVAGQGQAVSFEGEAGASYKLSLTQSQHDTIPVLVVVNELDQRVVVDSEPRVDGMSTAPLELIEGWCVVDWMRYRPPHASVQADVITYTRTPPADATEGWSGPTEMTSLALGIGPELGERMALAGDLLLDAQLDYGDISFELVRNKPRVLRWKGTAREGGRAVSGLVVVSRAGDSLRAISCVGPGQWATRVAPLETRLAQAVELAR